MININELLEQAISLYKSLNISSDDKKRIGKLYLNSPFFNKLLDFSEEDDRTFLEKVLSNQDRYLDPIFFLMASQELLKTTKTTELFSKLIVNANLIQFQPNCQHKDEEIVYNKKNSTYFPVFYENVVSFCKKCFKNYYEGIIEKNLFFIEKDDVIGIGVSGEKDSMAALKAICELRNQKKLEKFNLFVFFIDEGIKGEDGNIFYRENCENYVKEICKYYNIPLQIYRYRDIFGFTIDKLFNFGLNPCNFDSQLMSIVAWKFAYDNSITKMIGNMTENESFQFACVTLEGMKFNLPPFTTSIHSKTKIGNHKVENYNILLNIKDEENRIYLKSTKTNYNSTIKCPYNRFNIGKSNSSLINKMEEIHPGAISNFNLGLKKLALNKVPKKTRTNRVKFCPKCKLPSLTSNRKTCIICNLKHDLGA